MTVLAGLVALVLIVVVLLDAFETIILPRRIRRRLRITSVVYRMTWTPWRAWARHLRTNGRREGFLSFFGPLALIFLLLAWAVGLVVGFALLQWALGSHLSATVGDHNVGTDLYMSGTTFFTLGLGDVIPRTPAARFVTVLESGTGFAFLALVISYLPVIYQAFSRREVNVSLLDARAGSPPTGVELLRRLSSDDDNDDAIANLIVFLHEWEQWSAELLESHLSYPSLAYFRSQHENQSWLAALTTILDACALILVGIDGVPKHQAKLTFAMARHAAVDLSQVFDAPLKPAKRDCVSAAEFVQLRGLLAGAHMPLREGAEADAKLSHLRNLYEPFVSAIADRLLLPLPPWLPDASHPDDWQTSPEE